MLRQTACLLLLSCLAVFSFHPKGILASEGEQDGAVKDISPSGPYSMAIRGVDTVTVGVPYAFTCSASCTPACTFSWRNGNQSSTGAELTLQLKARPPQEVLTCVAINPDTGKTASISKTLVVTVGPSNIMISGPSMLTLGVENNFTCTATCYPSCTFSWNWMWEEEVLGSSSGATLSITPPETVDSETVLCEAMDSVSHLYISTSLQRYVARLTDIYITSPSGLWTVTAGQTFLFTCFVECTPSCTYTWTFEGKTYDNDQIHIPVFHKGEKPMIQVEQEISVAQAHRTEPLTCQAQNTVSGATISATQVLTIINPYSVRPATQGVPMAGKPFSLQCIGSQNPASITWLKNSLPLPVSERLVLSQDNTLLTFSPLMDSDTGTYQCVVNEEIGSIKSIGYEMQVNYGPFKVEIVEAKKGPVGKELTALAGSITALQCVADCYPGCSISWFYNGKMLSRNASISFTPVTPPNQAVLRCVAYDPLTMKNGSAETTVIVPYGPVDVTISGSSSLEVGVKATFTCNAACIPACTYTWSLYGSPVKGSSIDITLNRYVATESISCEAQNSVSGKTATVNDTLTVSDPQWCGC
ncbi:unnamed protein product [Lota lota]